MRADLLVRLITCAQNTLFLAHYVGTISQRGLCDGGGCLQKPWVAQVDVGLASIALDEVCRPRQLLELT